MAGAENRILTMKFDNRQFKQGATETLSILQKLKQSMSFGNIVGGTLRGLNSITSALSKIGMKTPFAPLIQGANKGLGLIGGTLDRLGFKNPFSGGVQGAAEMQRAAQAAGGPGGMGVLEGGVTAVSNKFLALSTIAITALSNITNRAINAGTSFAKSFSTAPIMDGLHEYELNLKSIQTVQANTDRPLTEINRSLDELNKYSDQTIYNFAEMARNVGTFTAAGVDLKTSVASIKGIANLAALSGSSSEQAAGAMYQLSQAIASGKVGLMDWNSVVNAGMGGKKLQNALVQTAVAMGKIDAAQVKGTKSGQQLKIAGDSFRESIMAKPGQESWLTSDILVNTLATMDGRFSKAALAAEKTETGLQKYTDAQIQARIETARTNLEQKNGVKYTDEQFRALQKMSTMAFKSATEVKTLGQVFDVAKETIASGWSASFRNIFGNLKQAKALFTGMSNGLNDIINANALARNTLLVAWSKGGGRNMLIEGLKNSWEALLGLLGPIKDGFRDIFPAKTATDLISMTKSFVAFTRSLIPSKATMADLRDISAGFFSIFAIGGQILGGIVTLLQTVFNTVGGGNGTFLNFMATIGRLITRFNEFLAESGLVTAFFEGLGGLLSVPVAALKGIGDILASIFAGFDAGAAGAVGQAVGEMGQQFGNLISVGDSVRAFFEGFASFFGTVASKIVTAFAGIGDQLAEAFTADNFGRTLDVIQTGLLAGIILLIRNFFKEGFSFDFSGGLFDGIKETLGEATGALQNMQQNLKANILLKLAAAIAVLALALLVLSGIDPAALAKALGAMSVGFGILIGAMATIFKVMGPAGLVQLYVVTSAMTKVALAILLMGFALKTLAKIEFVDMLRGLVGLSAMMFILAKAMVPLAAGSKGMAKASSSLILVGIALNILAIALKIMSSMSWEEMAKGLITMTGALLGIAVALKFMPTNTVAMAAGLIGLSVALNIMAVALKVFGTMSLEQIGKSMLVLAGSLGIIAAAISYMPKSMMFQAVALVAVAGAITILAGAMKIMGGMGWEEIGKGMTVLAGALIILAVGLRTIGLVGTIGAVGLLAAAGALAIFAPIMVMFGAMKWESILKSMTMLAGIFVVLGVASSLLAPLVPVVLALAAALVLLGAGIALMGVGALAAATAFTMVVGAGTAGIAVLTGLLSALIAGIAPALQAFGAGIVQFAVEIGKGAPKIAAAGGRLLMAFLNQVSKAIPRMGKIVLQLVNLAITVAVKAIPRLANAGMRMILGLINAAQKNVGKIVTAASSLVVNFLNALSRNLPRIINAGVRFVISFVNGTANAIRANKGKMADAGYNLASALVEALISGIRGGASRIAGAAVSAARSAFDAAKNFLGIGGPSKLFCEEVGKPIPAGMAGGIAGGRREVIGEIVDLGETARRKMTDIMTGVDSALAIGGNLNPVISPVLDLTSLSREANKMGGILDSAPIMPTVSYQTAADISAMTNDDPDWGGGGSGGGDRNFTVEQHLHSPTPISSVDSYRAGRTLIAVAKEELG